MAHLFLVRHGKSEWNNQGLWTGQTDVDLNELGYQEARRAGEALRDQDIHVVHVTELKRTHQTLQAIMDTIKKVFTPKIANALTERHYGIYTGKNKWEVKEEIGEEAFQNLRRGWDVAIPEGESLKDVYARVVPYFEEEILPDLEKGKNTLLVGHGNSFRALAKHLENLSEADVCSLEIGTGEVHCYTFEGREMRGKEILAANESKGKV
jgi:2,3-bisphosphoglycerate-dependent phosphoglycerate mutase